MYDALVARDFPLAAGCATAGTAVLAAGVLAADVGLAILDPRVPAGA
jgi:ABC-type dipeptide/oligopeptide/nickel transport system permease component